MGAGASALSVQSAQAVESMADANMHHLASIETSVSALSMETRDVALRLKDALCTPEGWQELQAAFIENSRSIDESISSVEWSCMVGQNDNLRCKYFGDAEPDEIATQFEQLDERGRGEMAFEQFVDGAMSLGVAISLADALATREGQADLKELWDDLYDVGPDGRVAIGEYAVALLDPDTPELLGRVTGLDRRISPRFEAFFITKKVQFWIVHALTKRLGLDMDMPVSWEEFASLIIAGGAATGTG